MDILKSMWNKCTNTKALELASGELEKCFFESVYRTVYLAGHSAYDRGILYMMYSSTIWVFFILLVICEIWELCTTTLSIDLLTDMVNVMIIQSSSFSKYWTMRKNQVFFKDLASSMESVNFDLSTEQRKKIMEMWHKRSEDSLNLLLCLGTVTLIVWHIYPLVDEVDYNLTVIIKLPFEYRTTIRYALVYITTSIIFSYAAYFVMTNDLLIQTYLMHLLCQYSVLNDCFRNILEDCKAYLNALDMEEVHLNEPFRRVYVKRLGNLVNQHNFILNNTMRLREIMSGPLLAQLGFSTMIFCSIGFKVATSANINMAKWFMSLLYLAYNMFVQYVMCKWCEEIKIEGEAIGESVYCSGWENGIVLVPGVRTSILLILARANKSIALSAGGMYDLTLEAYAQTVKTSYSALTVLLHMR